VPLNDRTDLLYLVRLRLCSVPLQIDLSFHPASTEHAVTSTCMFNKPEGEQERAEIFKTNVCIASATQHLLENLLVSGQSPKVSTTARYVRDVPPLDSVTFHSGGRETCCSFDAG